MIPANEYLSFLDAEYLRGYVENGGAAVKFLVPADDSVADGIVVRAAEVADSAGFVFASVDAATTRAHLLEQVFFEVARQVDWEALAANTAREAAAAAGYPSPEGGDVTLERLAAHYRVDARELKRDIDRELQRRVQRDYAMVQEFRTAMLRLCQAQLRSGQIVEAEEAAVLEWLRGQLRQISALRSALIFRRVTRNNARHMLFSLAHWLSINGRAGLVLLLDIRRLGFARRPSLEERQGLYYTKAALLDAYEVLRELVDNTDEMSNCLVLAVTPPTFASDPVRGLDAYQALKFRIYDEVRDRSRDNPFSSLVRVAA